jgi:16S rRNA (adenine1518-N6/adenine1519-N6)-dimethyltransferase
VRDAGVGSEDTVLEVGPGPGLLTRHLLAAGAQVRAIEIDPGMGPVASELLGDPVGDRLVWVEADAMAGGRRLSEALHKLLPGCSAMVANLPYGVAAPLLGSLVVEPQAPDLLVVMIQKEMGDRLVAAPGGRDYGPLAVLMSLTAEVRVLRKVPPQAFWPRPKVDSVVVRIERKSDRPSPGELVRLQVFLAAAFHSRRKMLVNSLSEAWRETPDAILSSIYLKDSEKRWRAEAFLPVQLCLLAQEWAQSALGERYRPWVGPSHRPH